MRLIRFALLAAVAAATASPLFAAGPAAPEGATMTGSGINVAASMPALSNKQRIAAAKAAWKASQLLATDAEIALRSTPFALELHQGKLTVDGTVARERLEYTVAAASQLNVYLPGEGTLVITPNAVAGATLVKAAFVGNNLAFTAAGHTVRVTTEGGSMMKGATVDAYVRLDKSLSARSQGDYLMMGYTVMQQAPNNSKPAATAELTTIASR